MDADLIPLIEKAAAALKAAGAREVYVFGSASKGTLRPNSDVDMAVSGLPPEVFSARWLMHTMLWDARWTWWTWTMIMPSPATSWSRGSCTV